MLPREKSFRTRQINDGAGSDELHRFDGDRLFVQRYDI